MTAFSFSAAGCTWLFVLQFLLQLQVQLQIQLHLQQLQFAAFALDGIENKTTSMITIATLNIFFNIVIYPPFKKLCCGSHTIMVIKATSTSLLL
ncbi:MAG: hypothetical protein ACFNPW_02245 [Candidatus Nanosyncoccus sp.]